MRKHFCTEHAYKQQQQQTNKQEHIVLFEEKREFVDVPDVESVAYRQRDGFKQCVTMRLELEIMSIYSRVQCI